MEILTQTLFIDKQSTSSNLSPDHFLAPRKIFLGHKPSDSNSAERLYYTSDSQDDTQPVDTTTLASADFDVDVQSGFLSPSPPLKKLTDSKFNAWESALDWIQNIISEKLDTENQKEDQVKNWKQHVISNMGIINIDSLLLDIIELRRAHLVLAFLTHAFVHSDSLILNIPQPNQGVIIIPASLAVPFCQISHALDIPPVLTYADTVLYNWYFKNPALGFIASNVEITTTFTQTESEKHFYRTSVLVEALGPESLKLMRSSLDEAFMGDSISVKRIGINLGKLSKQIDCIIKVLGEIRAGCDPKTFYWDIRPWFNAGKWQWEGVNEPSNQIESIFIKEGTENNWRLTDFGGPSAGQSTLIHAIDVFLGINHEPNGQELENGIHNEETFMNRMTTYMPHHHRLFLKHLSQSCLIVNDNNQYTKEKQLIRSIVMDNKNNHDNSILQKNYNECIKSLENLRATHTKIVSLFIISQKNSKNYLFSNSVSSFISKQVKPNKQEINHYFEEKEEESYPVKLNEQENQNLTIYSRLSDTADLNKPILKGTGGTDLSKFLKRCKHRTTEALILDD